MPSPEMSVLTLKLSRFRVAGHDDESDEATKPVRVICSSCKRLSPWFTTPLHELVAWADAHQCLRNVGE